MGRAWVEVEKKILSLLHGHKTRTRLLEIHAHFLRHNLHRSNQILAHFVSVCGSLHNMAYANCVFQRTQYPNIFLFNSMIKAYSLNGPFEESLLLFSSMKHRGIWPDEYTFAPLLKACSNLVDSAIGRCVHGEVIRVGFECYGSIRIGVVELYTSSCRMEDAMKVFDETCNRDVIVWNLIIRGFCKRGDVDTGLYFFRQMSVRSVVSWNSMISFLAHSGRDSEALELFHEMRDHYFKLDEATVVTVLPICARLGAVDVGKWLHSYAESTKLYRDFVSVGNALVDFYCKCGILETASRLFNEMPRKNLVSWNAMVLGMAFNGKGELGVELFEEMINEGVRPDEASFVGVLACCAHAGLVGKGQDLFATMTENHHIVPKVEHVGCMVDLLGRSGCVKEAYGLIRRIPMRPNAALWGALLSSCRTHGDVELAELAVKELKSLEQWNSGNYVLLSNIYAEEGRWDEVEKVRVLMRDKSVKKAPGQSAIG
ncbi:PPR domain-containing protein/PPR_1 domain-containing protein/PPR_2 domain-containing protein [Cephalotus follicularis]|uniref:PPR domain-containing protein/PPR_1 domain-containing protein/PPR_2 domain-containing protein n=1 Tax=Cephalotus follicularis TaxID=3775 RepID=A0A1Q3C2H9_CEPFO|nr:PPR domain-containing protein/PPR_1 domain-containing protein/PPR_2 domain-containing protein [Cephalotus follicularis]